MPIPTLSTPRLILRGHRPEDFPAFAATRADPDFVRHMGSGVPRSEEEAWAGFLHIAGLWEMAGFGSWAIEEKQTGALIGDVGFNERKRNRGPNLRGVPEMGWAIATSAAGKGYATEALRAALAWGLNRFGALRTIALIAPDNDASVRVAEKCGFVRAPDIVSAGRPRMLFERIL